MNIKKKVIKALSPDFVFENRRGRRIIINSKTTIDQLVIMGARIELRPQEKPLPPLAYGYIGDTAKVGNEGTKISTSASGTCADGVL